MLGLAVLVAYCCSLGRGVTLNAPTVLLLSACGVPSVEGFLRVLISYVSRVKLSKSCLFVLPRMDFRSHSEVEADIRRVSDAVHRQLSSLFANGKKAAQHQLCKEATRSLFSLSANKARLQSSQGRASQSADAGSSELSILEERIEQCVEDLDVLGKPALLQLCSVLLASNAQLVRLEESTARLAPSQQPDAIQSYANGHPEQGVDHGADDWSQLAVAGRHALQESEVHDQSALSLEQSAFRGFSTPNSATCR